MKVNSIIAINGYRVGHQGTVLLRIFPLRMGVVHSVSTVLRRNEVETISMRRLHHFDVSIRETFNLSPSDYSS